MCQRCFRSPLRLAGSRRGPKVLVDRLTRGAETRRREQTDTPQVPGEPQGLTAPTSKDPGGTALPRPVQESLGAAPTCARGRGLPRRDLNFGAEWAGSVHTLSTLRPVGHPARTQDSLPAVGQTLPGGLFVPLGSSERFLRCFLHRFPPFPRLTLTQTRSGPPRECRKLKSLQLSSRFQNWLVFQGFRNSCSTIISLIELFTLRMEKHPQTKHFRIYLDNEEGFIRSAVQPLAPSDRRLSTSDKTR